MSILVAISIAFVWIVAGRVAGRLYQLDWRKSFGDESGLDHGMLSMVSALGPIGLISAVLTWGRGVPHRF